jgi:YVTN family beta-propeller protein
MWRARIGAIGAGTLSLLAILVSAAAGGHGTIGRQIHIGVAPSVLTISKDGRFAYVVDSNLSAHTSGPGHLAVVSVKRKRVVRKIRVQYNPEAIARSRDGTKIFVANYGSDTVSVISRKRWKVVRTIHVGQAPGTLLDMIINGREFLVVANSGHVEPARGSLYFIRIADFKLVRAVRFRFNPIDLAPGPKDRTVYVADGNAPRVLVVSTRTMKVSAHFSIRDPLGFMNALGVSRTRKLLYAVGGASTSVVSTKTRRTLAHFREDPPGNPIRVGIGPHGLALILNGENQNPVPGSLTVLRRTKKVRVVKDLGVFPIDVKVSPNGRTTWVTNNLAGTVSVFPTRH